MPQNHSQKKGQLSRTKTIIFKTITFSMVFSFIALSYFSTILWRSYRHQEHHPRRVGSVYRVDKDYGYFPKPDSAGFFSQRCQEPVPQVFDHYCFRVPLRKEQIDLPYRGGILFLGCSFTHGDGVPAEKTFPYLTAKGLNLRAMNAGMSGAGLCQMLMRARQDIPRFKPKYVVVQYSNWLIRRSQRYYKDTSFGKTPGPYFYEKDGEILIHPPAFLTKNADVPIVQYLHHSLLSFTWHVGIPLYTHDDYYSLLTVIKRILGILPKPAESRKALVSYTYSEIEKLCRANGSKMIVVKLYMDLSRMPSYGLDDLGYPVLDTREMLASRLPEKTRSAWRREYQFMNNNHVIDIHPNPKAHALIAESIITKIRTLDAKSEGTAGRAAAAR